MLDVSVRRQVGAFLLDASFAVPESGLTALFGRSGSGKTSTVNCIAGLVRPDAGHVRMGERALYDSSLGVEVPAHQRRLGYVFQESRLFPHLSVRSNLLYGLRRAPTAERRISSDQVIELLGLKELLERRSAQLSGGEKQRVAIGRAILAQPRLLLMDEPLASLDAPRKRQILPYIERLRDELGVAIVYVSHSLEEVVRLAQQVVVFDQGRVAAVGSPAELSQRLELRALFGDYEAGVVLEARVAAHDAVWQITTLAFDGGQLKVPGLQGKIGSRVRLRVRERDLSVAIEAPRGVSIQNALEGEIAELEEQAGPFAEVKIRVGASVFVARITRESAHRLGLAQGRKVWALVKSVSLEDAPG